jgi:hypothetical protein
MAFSAEEFILHLMGELSPLVIESRFVKADFSNRFSERPRSASVTVNFFNLPEARVRQRRGGGAEGENNRQLFMVWGFEPDASAPVDKVKLEQSINGIGGHSGWAPKLRSKTASPEKIAAYLAKYISDVAAAHEPNFTHE